MLQKITDKLKSGSVAAIMVAVIGAALAFTGKGLSDRFEIATGPESAATVDGVRVERQEAIDTWRDLQVQLQQGGITPTEDEIKRYQDEVLERLVVSHLVAERARELGYRVSGGRIQAEIRSEPAFQVEGAYNENLALSRLAQIGLTAEQYRRDILKRLQAREIQQTTALSEFVTPIEYGRRVALEDEQRKVAVLDYPRDKFRAWVDTSETMLGAWYAANGQRFLTPESVALQIASIKMADVMPEAAVSEDDLKAEYAKNLDRYQEPERRRVRHILVNDEKTANDVLAKLRGGADFAATASASSKDTVSAAQGGDLGLSEKGAFVPAFADAAFALKSGELSGPVKTEFGYHLIRVDAIEAARGKAFEEVRAELETELKRELAAQRLTDREEQAQKLAAESSADLAKIAAQLGLKVASVDEYVRGVGGGLLAGDPGLSEAVFSDEALLQRRIGGPSAFGDDGFLMFRVVEHRKPRVPALAEIRDRVVAAYVEEQADALALAQAREVAARVNSGEFRPPASGRFVDRRDPSLSKPQKDAAFALARPTAGKILAGAVSLPTGGASVVIVDEVRNIAGGGDAAVKALRAQNMQVATAQGLIGAFIRDMREKAEVEKHPEVFSN